MIDKLALALGKTGVGLAFECARSFFKNLECGRRVGCIVSVVITQRSAQLLVKRGGALYFGKNKLAEFLQLFVGIS